MTCRIACVILIVAFVQACAGDDNPAPPGPGDTSNVDTIPFYSTYRIVNEYPHDDRAFTQGLVYYDGFMYEGTGLNRASTLRKVDLETGEIVHIRFLDKQYFGEGIAIMGDTIVQLTYLSRVAFVYDRESFSPLGTFTYDTQGWGLTYDGEHLIMSDGYARLTFRHPRTFAEERRIFVRDGKEPVSNLNELEYIDGRIFANVWQTDFIVIIDPATGDVEGWIDCTGLRADGGISGAVGVLNGIAYDAERKRLFVTGKQWPKIFEIELIPQ